ncbi:MAG: 4Fe-4S binding protein, partial [Proteocatella sp.]
KKKILNIRHVIQLISAALINGYAAGFTKGKIFTGDSKALCVPVLNCYSCPGALGACPVGALQAVISGKKYNFSFYVLGTIMLFGVIFGRLICGFLCPFGFIQDLLHKIPFPKISVHKKIDKPLRLVKYIIAIVMVILLPMLLTNKYGIAPPYFCKWICPAGTLEGGIPLILTNESLRASLGFLFSWKMGILILTIVLSMSIYRPFCKYVCPLGAFYALFNKISFYKMTVDKDKCTSCGICINKCKMQVDVINNINSTECIRCGECKKSCPSKAIK